MKCFNHSDSEAVAVCKACGRAVCPECLQESENGIACSTECTAVLAEQKKLQAGLAGHLKSLKRMNFLSSVFSIGMGILFLYFSSLGFGLVYDFVLLLGAGFTGYGLLALLVNVIIVLKSRKTGKN